ncbi:tRNA (adenosine(37)-N6)-threonylcarbamoyltransferase complex dimerization subunit type 1 TsaB [Sagittula salina]|uniref:tRNA (Adenosine(37)-N6)-threonylcarbamoyltransferase complex dimerization subunit type 1 TsaB n=1 Tax=Sagittula salina TaxID=2820268 RepID=A0A940MMR4_9RHOB|nr:tRNA (adenosine(37)-N6)-threonylcarbamoyltransferase complex dimerization subunit type 1 TsaB [Sagittula salina]MBP0481612.1 tRNA (adenosine(37)-N6)-threonylcarbamoyltransferase complex dimerization subunit type 1 TsaB [Sagittula salina]
MILAFDTSTSHVIAALLDGDRLFTRNEEMGRGQAERLMPLLEEILLEAGARWQDITRIGVGVGPGNFTGIRISVSTARGLALGLRVPAVGVSTFEVIHHGTPQAEAAVPAPRQQVYTCTPGGTPVLIEPHEGLTLPPAGAAWAAAIARVAAAKTPDQRPAPLYVRPADAAPSKEPPPVILDDAGIGAPNDT